MQAGKRLLAAALTLSLPIAALAQAPAPEAKPEAPAAQPAPAAEAEAKPAPKKDEVKVTPYGFVQLSAFDNLNSFTTKDYPAAATKALDRGSFLMSSRYSRFGVNIGIDEEQWTRATVAGRIEFDFKGGHFANSSSGWYNGIMRLRIATITANWKTPAGAVQFLAGQDYGLVNPLFATTITWTADPLFWQAGNIWRRGPQARITWTGSPELLGANLAFAVLSPQTNETGTIQAGPTAVAPAVTTVSPAYAVDYGAGNRSRLPDFEGRAGMNAKITPDIGLATGVGFKYGKRRYGTVASPTDTTGWMLGADADLNIPFFEAKGEWYDGKASDDTYQGIIMGSTTIPGTTTSVNLVPVGAFTSGYKAMRSTGWWGQGILKLIPEVWLVGGYGLGTVDKGDLGVGMAQATTAGTLTPTSVLANVRTRNSQTQGGVIFNAGKHWKFGAEAVQTRTTYFDNTFRTGWQVAGSTQLLF
jgi:hypothetical protein